MRTENTKRRRVNSRQQLKARVLAERAVLGALTMSAFGPRALQVLSARNVPKGLGRGHKPLLLRNANGTYAIDPVTLNKIPKQRAVRVGKHWYDSKTLRRLIHSRRPINPLTREPLPNAVQKKFAGRPTNNGRPSNNLPPFELDRWNDGLESSSEINWIRQVQHSNALRKLWSAALTLADMMTPAHRAASRAELQWIRDRYGVTIVPNANRNEYKISLPPGTRFPRSTPHFQGEHSDVRCTEWFAMVEVSRWDDFHVSVELMCADTNRNLYFIARTPLVTG